MAWREPQKAANSLSNCATTGPPAKALLSITSPIARSNSARKGAWWALRSRNGTLILGSLRAMQDDSRVPGNDRVRRDIPRHNTSGTDQGVFPDSNTAEEGSTGANRGSPFFPRLLAVRARAPCPLSPLLI